MGTTLSSLIKNNQIPVTAGTTILQNALLEIFSDGYAYPCSVADYAATPNKGTAILAATAISFSSLNNWTSGTDYGCSPNSPMIQDSLGNLYVLTANTTSGTGLVCSKYSAAGAFIGSLVIDSVGTAVNYANIGILSNGNLFAVYSVNSTAEKFSIFTPQLVSVVAATALNNSFASDMAVASIPLSGGGFAAVYGTSTTNLQLSIYSNAGGFLYSAANTVDATQHISGLAQLSNGNIVVAFNNTATLKFGIYSTTASVVVATTSTGIAIANAAPVAVSVLASGFFALASYTNTTSTPANAAVFSNAGAIQGSIIVSTGGNGTSIPLGLVNDGTNFWLITSNGGTTQAPIYTKITTAGVATVTAIGMAFGAAEYSNFCVGYDGCGIIIIMSGNATTTTLYSAFSVNLGIELVSATTIAAGAASNANISMLMVGDGAFAAYTYPSATATDLSIWKAVNSAIIGPAQAAAAPAAQVQVIVASGYYPINKLKGTQGKAFTMKSGANLYGNNGSINGIGVAQQGM